MYGLLSILVWLPIAAGIVVLILGDRFIAAGRWLALLASVATLVLTFPLLAHFDASTATFQFVERVPWITTFHADYHLGVDGISLNDAQHTARVSMS